MLYVTTRGTQDAYTVHRTMNQDRGPDGGFFVPMRIPVYSPKDVLVMSQKGMNQNIAEVLNMFFGTKITSWDVDVAVGRNVMSVRSAGHKTSVVELWHNIDGNFDRVIAALAEYVTAEAKDCDAITNWVDIGIRIAVLVGVFEELLNGGLVSREKPVDVSVTSGSFAMPMALWYARYMGLPIRNIICGCNENGAVWELLHKGELDPNVLSVSTTTPEADFAVPPNLERLIYATLGSDEVHHYWWSCTEGRCYSLPEPSLSELNRGMFAAVVSKSRIETIIPSVYRTNQYILDPYGALAYGALSDYRSRTGSVGPALVLAEKSPLYNAAMVAASMQISSDELKNKLGDC